MTVQRVRALFPKGGGGHAPRMVIDETGGEVAVLVDYSQYVVLLAMIASELERRELPAYWREAMADGVRLTD